jgi:hypothetical protein
LITPSSAVTVSITNEASDMADEKIVTKKTVAKPAASTNPTPATDPIAKKTVAKKAVAKAAAPAPSTPPAPPITKAAVTATAAKAAEEAKAPPLADPAQPPSTTAPAKKGGAKEAAPAKAPVAPPAPHLPLEEKPVSLQHLANVTPHQRYEMVREAAYYKAEKRNFAAGNDARDWVDAEREIDELLAKARQIFGA